MSATNKPVTPEDSSATVETSWLAKLGPGLVTGAADDDPSGIATYSQAGAQFGFNLPWSCPNHGCCPLGLGASPAAGSW